MDHVRILNDADLAAYVRNEPDEVDVRTFDILWYKDFPDAWDESTDTHRTFTIEIHFDAPTDLEASLATSAVAGFVRRRLSLDNVVIIGRDNT